VCRNLHAVEGNDHVEPGVTREGELGAYAAAVEADVVQVASRKVAVIDPVLHSTVCVKAMICTSVRLNLIQLCLFRRPLIDILTHEELVDGCEFLSGIEGMQAHLALLRTAGLAYPDCLKSHPIVFVLKRDSLSNRNAWKSNYASAMDAQIERAHDLPRTIIGTQSPNRQREELPSFLPPGHTSK
jgi:hypothetical protein